MKNERKKLSDILHGDAREALKKAWNESEAADETRPLPAGEYVARIIAGELTASRTKATPGYELTFRILEGDYVGQRIWHRLWLTPQAMPFTKRELVKLGVPISLSYEALEEQLERPIPQGIRCQVKLVLRKTDQGVASNEVRSFIVLGIDAVEPDPFAPAPPHGEPQS